MSRFKNKTLATFLAALFGTFGLHRFYLQDGHGWIPWTYPIYFLCVSSFGLHHLASLHSDLGTDFITFLHPSLLAAFLPTAAGLVESLVFALTPDAAWDKRWNLHSARVNHSGAWVIVLAIFSLAVGTTGVLSILAISIQAYFEGTL